LDQHGPDLQTYWYCKQETIGNFLGNILVRYRPISPKENLPAEVNEKGENVKEKGGRQRIKGKGVNK
jgi:uncharacterized protein (UPF0333 family)